MFCVWMLESLFGDQGHLDVDHVEKPGPQHIFLKISGTQGSCTNQWQKTGILKKPPEAKAHCSTRGQGHLHTGISLGIGFVSF